MKIYEPNNRGALTTALLNVWEDSVRATHLFLSDAEIIKIKEYVPQALRDVEHLIIAEDDFGNPLGFIGTESCDWKCSFFYRKKEGKGQAKSCCNTL